MKVSRAIPNENVRMGGHPYGIHRVVKPAHVLPQAAEVLDVSLPIYQNETLILVDQLNIDSASFRQLKESCRNDPKAIGEKISAIVRTKGKMQNPVTGSGGMLIGEVLQMGKEAPQNFRVGDRVATLVSLTLTPLYLEKLFAVEIPSGHVHVKGHAILFASSVAVKLPKDLPEALALSALDVCGAPAWVRKKIKPSDKVLIMGAGKSGVLSALAATEVIPKQSLWMADQSDAVLQEIVSAGLTPHTVKANAQDAIGFTDTLSQSDAPIFDFVINTCNVPETEMSALLSTRNNGRILFFNMATSFSRAVLSAEGMGREVEMIMGNGYAEGHSDYALDLVRRNPKIQKWFVPKNE
jgi:L-erythro-3,5-diaminohexanoate dehydrogenase